MHSVHTALVHTYQCCSKQHRKSKGVLLILKLGLVANYKQKSLVIFFKPNKDKSYGAYMRFANGGNTDADFC